ncbi:hypothetical protein, partial [Yimella lutea]|uniref:hypothetical protein n=1 Tax=Yimella lutea TaxID=587872 RepID=UPI0031EC88D3
VQSQPNKHLASITRHAVEFSRNDRSPWFGFSAALSGATSSGYHRFSSLSNRLFSDFELRERWFRLADPALPCGLSVPSPGDSENITPIPA